MKKRKTRKASIRMKILIPCTLIIIIICVLLTVNAYVLSKSEMISMGVEQAEMVADFVRKQVDIDRIKTIKPGIGESDDYIAIRKQMQDAIEGYTVKYLYTLYKDGDKVCYGVDTDTSSTASSIGDVFESNQDELIKVFDGDKYVQNYIDKNEYGHLISVFLPIEDENGNVISAIGCDYDATNIEDNLKTTLFRILILSILSGLIAIVILNIIVARIMRSLHKVSDKVYDLVHNEGDLTQTLDVKSGDELEIIATNVNDLLSHIRTIMLAISNSSTKLNSSSKEVVDNLAESHINITDVSASMEEMSAAMQQTSASMSVINQSIVDINEEIEGFSNKALEGSEFSSKIQQNAIKIKKKADTSQSEAKEQAKTMAAAVNSKIEKSKAVEEIRDLTAHIIGITEQTNLLALNASIEAARAGEAGRGFAVVASEISNLATGSAEAASQIEKVSDTVIEAVNELASEAEEMIRFMDEVAMEGYNKLLDTSDNYRSDAAKLNSIMEDFASSSSLLKQTISEIKESIESVNLAVEESTKVVIGVTETSGNLADSMENIGNEADANLKISDELSDEVNKFKLE